MNIEVKHSKKQESPNFGEFVYDTRDVTNNIGMLIDNPTGMIVKWTNGNTTPYGSIYHKKFIGTITITS